MTDKSITKTCNRLRIDNECTFRYCEEKNDLFVALRELNSIYKNEIGTLKAKIEKMKIKSQIWETGLISNFESTIKELQAKLANETRLKRFYMRAKTEMRWTRKEFMQEIGPFNIKKFIKEIFESYSDKL